MLRSLQRDLKYHQEKNREYEKKIRQLEQTVSEEIESRERARSSFQVWSANSKSLSRFYLHRSICYLHRRCALSIKEFKRRLANALSVEYRETVHPSPEIVMHKVEELVQEANRVRAKNTNIEAQLTTAEVDFRSCRDALDCTVAEKEQLQRQVSSQLVDLDRLRQVSIYLFRSVLAKFAANGTQRSRSLVCQDKECLEMRYKVAERELDGLRDKLLNANRSISNATGNISSQEALIGQLQGDSFGEYILQFSHSSSSLVSSFPSSPPSSSQKIWRNGMKSVSVCKPSYVTFWNRWQRSSAARTDSSSLTRMSLRIALGRSWPRTKIRLLYFLFVFVLSKDVTFDNVLRCTQASSGNAKFVIPWKNLSSCLDDSKASRQGKRGNGIDYTARRIDRNDRGEDAKSRGRTIGPGK